MSVFAVAHILTKGACQLKFKTKEICKPVTLE